MAKNKKDFIIELFYYLVNLCGIFLLQIFSLIPCEKSLSGLTMITLVMLVLVMALKKLYGNRMKENSNDFGMGNALNTGALFMLIVYIFLEFIIKFYKIGFLNIKEDSLLSIYNFCMILSQLVFLVIGSKCMLLYPITVLFKVKCRKAIIIFLTLFIGVPLMIEFLEAEDIAFFVAILLSLSMSAQTYQNIASFLDKAEIIKSDSTLRAFFNRPSDLDDDEQWDGKIQLQKIVLSGLLIIFYLIFKYTEQIPLSGEYFFIRDSFDTLPFWDIVFFSLVKSLDKIFGFFAIVLFLLTFEKINKLINQIAWFEDITHLKEESKNRKIFLIFILVVFILPFVFNFFANNKFQSEIETRLQVEGISQYESTFYNRYDLRSKEKRIEVKHQCDRLRIIAIKDKTYPAIIAIKDKTYPIGIQPIIELKGKTYQRTYIYKEKQVKLLETKEILN